jgi:hypothetical protein
VEYRVIEVGGRKVREDCERICAEQAREGWRLTSSTYVLYLFRVLLFFERAA